MKSFKLISNDNASFIEVCKIKYNIEEGYHPSVALDLKIKTNIINYLGSDFWYNKSDIDNAIVLLTQLENKKNITLNFKAYSEFILMIKMHDSVGHYCIDFSVDDPMNKASFNSTYLIDYAVLSSFKLFLIEIQKGF
jgi:hypothetical protein